MKILHLEDSPDDAALARELIAAEWPDCVITVVATKADFLAALDRGGHDLILSDFNLPGYGGLAAHEHARAHAPDLPFIFLSGTIGEDTAVAAMRAGASDYVMKDRLQRLAPAIAAAVREATARQRAEAALADSRQKLDAIIHSVDGIVWEADTQTFQFTFVSQRAERLLGYACERWIKEPTFWSDHIHPEDRERAVNFCVKATAEKKNHEFEYRMLAADGRVVWLHNIVKVVVENDQSIKLRGIMVDITARKQAEVALQESQGRWQFALEGAGDGVWDWELPTSTVFFSKRYKEMLGYAEDEFGTGPEEWSSRIHPEDLPRVMADLQSHLDGVTTIYAPEFRARCKDGSYKWILARGLVISRDPAGKPLRMVGTYTDISVRKQSEGKLCDQLTELQRWQRVTQGREERVQALKREVNALLRRGGEPERYGSVSP